MAWHRNGLHAADVPLAASAVYGGVTIQALLPVSAQWNSDAVVSTWNRSEVQRNKGHIRWVFGPPDKSDDAAFKIVAVHPLKSGSLEIYLVERRLSAVERVQIAHPSQQARMKRILQEVPIEAALVVPLIPLAEVSSHE